MKMYHPDLPHTKTQPTEVSRKSYDQVWKNKGWRIHPPKTTTTKTKEK